MTLIGSLVRWGLSGPVRGARALFRDQERALAELFRVIRPGGELRFYKHVVGHSQWAQYQRFADTTFGLMSQEAVTRRAT